MSPADAWKSTPRELVLATRSYVISKGGKVPPSAKEIRRQTDRLKEIREQEKAARAERARVQDASRQDFNNGGKP